MKKNKLINKKPKGVKKAVVKIKLMFEKFKKGEIIRKSQQILKNELHNIHIIEMNKVALSSNDNKILQTFDRDTSFPHETNAFKLCKNEMQDVCKAKETLLSEDCESDICMTCNIFLKYMEAKCKSQMKKVCENQSSSCF